MPLPSHKPAPSPFVEGPYECLRCEVKGRGTECWCCGQKDQCRPRISVALPGSHMPLATVKEMIQPDTPGEP